MAVNENDRVGVVVTWVVALAIAWGILAVVVLGLIVLYRAVL